MMHKYDSEFVWRDYFRIFVCVCGKNQMITHTTTVHCKKKFTSFFIFISLELLDSIMIRNKNQTM